MWELAVRPDPSVATAPALHVLLAVSKRFIAVYICCVPSGCTGHPGLQSAHPSAPPPPPPQEKQNRVCFESLCSPRGMCSYMCSHPQHGVGLGSPSLFFPTLFLCYEPADVCVSTPSFPDGTRNHAIHMPMCQCAHAPCICRCAPASKQFTGVGASCYSCTALQDGEMYQ